MLKHFCTEIMRFCPDHQDLVITAIHKEIFSIFSIKFSKQYAVEFVRPVQLYVDFYQLHG